MEERKIIEENRIIELIYLTKQGNQEALNYLLKFCYRYIENVLYSKYPFITKIVNDEELIQEAMLTIHRCIFAYCWTSEATFKTYITICSVRRWYTMISKRQSKISEYKYSSISLDRGVMSKESGKNQVTVLDTIEDPYPMNQPEQSLYIKEMLENAYSVIDSAKNKDVKTLFELKSYGYSDSEIAKIMNNNEKWVTNTLYRYRKKFDFNKH